ncbi:hypothetical protein RF55_14532 [Lasius niger]|uniref:Uncharacterized protein n=1 Tax=Lasius niger TaxID=67767 RepID=A0A0J7K859_LASNI|nr:hypothetical protein RF55_14532 [Lasius niger]
MGPSSENVRVAPPTSAPRVGGPVRHEYLYRHGPADPYVGRRFPGCQAARGKPRQPQTPENRHPHPPSHGKPWVEDAPRKKHPPHRNGQGADLPLTTPFRRAIAVRAANPFQR